MTAAVRLGGYWLARLALTLVVSGAAMTGGAVFYGGLASADLGLRVLLILGLVGVLLGLVGLALRVLGRLGLLPRWRRDTRT